MNLDKEKLIVTRQKYLRKYWHNLSHVGAIRTHIPGSAVFLRQIQQLKAVVNAEERFKCKLVK